MSQLSIGSGKSNPIARIYLIINSESFLGDLAAWQKGNKSAGRRVRKLLLEVGKLSTSGRKMILDSS